MFPMIRLFPVSLFEVNLFNSLKNKCLVGKVYRPHCPARRTKSSNNMACLEKEAIDTSFEKKLVDTVDIEMKKETELNKDEMKTTISGPSGNTWSQSSGHHDNPENVPIDPSLIGMSRRARKRMLKKEMIKEKKKTAKKNRNPGFSSDFFTLTDYYYENGLRKVYPYYFSFESFVKRRWVGRSLFQILKEFQMDTDEPNKSMEELMKDGDVTLNGKAVTADRVLKDGDHLAHRIHRHENPVVGTPLEVLVDDENVIVINKPSSIPSHPCGRYRFNSVPFIIGKDLGYTNLRSVYRLDRPTSGLLILAKTAEKSSEIHDDILQKRVQKEYLARVLGRFPEGVVECDQPLGALSHKDSLYGVVPGGKESKTVFEYISYNGSTSLIRCLPKSGRTHQIRLHLQYLGFPIKNDPLYNESCFGPSNGKGGILEKSLTEIVKSFRENHNTGTWVDGDNPLFQKRLEEEAAKMIQSQKHLPCQMEVSNSNLCEEEASGSNLCQKEASGSNLCQKEASDSSLCQKEASGSNLCQKEALDSSVPSRTSFSGNEPQAKRLKISDDDSTSTVLVTSEQCITVRTVERPEFDPQKWVPDAKCFHCKTQFKDPSTSNMIMYLHALKYKGSNWQYETPLPDWAKEDWIEPV